MKNDVSMEVCSVFWTEFPKAVRLDIWTFLVEVKMQACWFRDVLRQERLSPYHNMVANDIDGCCVFLLNWWNTWSYILGREIIRKSHIMWCVLSCELGSPFWNDLSEYDDINCVIQRWSRLYIIRRLSMSRTQYLCATCITNNSYGGRAESPWHMSLRSGIAIVLSILLDF